MRKSFPILVCALAITMLLLSVPASAFTKVAMVGGNITAVDTAAGTVTITTTSKVDVVLAVTDKTVIIREMKNAAIADLVIGDRAEAAYTVASDGTKTAVRISARAYRPPVFDAKGVVTAVSLDPASVTLKDAKGATLVLPVASTTVISRNGQTATLADLAVNDVVCASYIKKLDGSLEAVRIVAVTPKREFTVKGTISAIAPDGSTVTIFPGGMMAVICQLKIAPTTLIIKDGKNATVADLKVKDLVQAVYDSTMTAKKITATTPKPPVYALRGIINSVDLEAKTVGVGTVSSIAMATILQVTDSTYIVKNDAQVAIDALAKGDIVDATYVVGTDGVKTALQIRARTPAPVPVAVCGTISKLDADNQIVTVTVTGPNKTQVTVDIKVTGDTLILKGNQKVGFDALAVDDRISAKYIKTSDGTLVAQYIQVLPPPVVPPTVVGVITSIMPSVGVGPAAAPGIQVKTAAGRLVVVQLAPGCAIIKDGVAAQFGDLRVGDLVSAYGAPSWIASYTGVVAVKIVATSPVTAQ